MHFKDGMVTNRDDGDAGQQGRDEQPDVVSKVLKPAATGVAMKDGGRERRADSLCSWAKYVKIAGIWVEARDVKGRACIPHVERRKRCDGLQELANEPKAGRANVVVAVVCVSS